MKKFLAFLYFPYRWLIFLPLVALATFFFGFMAVILLFFLNAKTVSYLCGTMWSRFNAFITPMFVSVVGRNNIDPNQSYVVVSNHKSQFDIFVLYGWLGVDFKWVMKKELRKIPFLGIACEKLGHVFIDRSNRTAALASLEEARERIVNGTSVLFFPEGTRSSTSEMRPFKKGAFMMALDLNLPVLPVTIIGTEKILPNHSLRLLPGKSRLVIHRPVPIDEYSRKNMGDLMDKVRTVIQTGVNEYPL